ncbi:hypothetical protein SH449x_001659 [Pirellulaceae bacterium SH449]
MKRVPRTITARSNDIKQLSRGSGSTLAGRPFDLDLFSSWRFRVPPIGKPWAAQMVLVAIVRFAFVALLSVCIADKMEAQQEFIDNYDMNGDYARYVYSASKIRVWNQAQNGYEVRSWGPRSDNEPGILILRYQFDRPIMSATVRFNLLLHRPESTGKVEVSHDNKTYTLLTETEQRPAESANHQSTLFVLTPTVRGERQVFLRITLTGKQLNSSIMGTDFLRTSPGIPKFNSPLVYEFRAITE